jgi:hypothetical protein
MYTLNIVCGSRAGRERVDDGWKVAGGQVEGGWSGGRLEWRAGEVRLEGGWSGGRLRAAGGQVEAG